MGTLLSDILAFIYLTEIGTSRARHTVPLDRLTISNFFSFQPPTLLRLAGPSPSPFLLDALLALPRSRCRPDFCCHKRRFLGYHLR